MKENFSPLQAGCAEKKFHRYQQNAVKKKFSPLKSQEISLKYVTDGAVDYEAGDTHEVEDRTLVRQFLFCKISGECGKKKFFTAIQRNSYKNSPLSAPSTLKDAGALR